MEFISMHSQQIGLGTIIISIVWLVFGWNCLFDFASVQYCRNIFKGMLYVFITTGPIGFVVGCIMSVVNMFMTLFTKTLPNIKKSLGDWVAS